MVGSWCLWLAGLRGPLALVALRRSPLEAGLVAALVGGLATGAGVWTRTLRPLLPLSAGTSAVSWGVCAAVAAWLARGPWLVVAFPLAMVVALLPMRLAGGTPIREQPVGPDSAALAGGGAHVSVGWRSDDDGGACDCGHVGGVGAVRPSLGGGRRDRFRDGDVDLRLGQSGSAPRPGPSRALSNESQRWWPTASRPSTGSAPGCGPPCRRSTATWRER